MEEDYPSIDELKEMVAKELEEAERRVKLYALLLDLLDQCGSLPPRRAGDKEFRKIDYVDSSGSTGLTLYLGKTEAQIFFMKPVITSNPYIRYLVHVLNRLAEENENISYDIGSDGENVKTIIVVGLDEDSLEDIATAVDYVARRLGLKPVKKRESKGEE